MFAGAEEILGAEIGADAVMHVLSGQGRYWATNLLYLENMKYKVEVKRAVDVFKHAAEYQQ